MNMKNQIVILILIFLAILLVSGCTKVKESSIKIGIMLPLTGDAASWGKGVKNGIEFAYKDKIKIMDINGKRIKFIYEDTKCDGKEGLNSFYKLINVDKVKVTGGTICSSVVLSIAPIAEKNKIIHLSAGASSPDITNAGDYIFRIWPSDTLEGSKIALFALKDLNLRKVGILYINNEYGIGLRDVFKEVFESNGGKIAIEESFEVNANDFRTQLSKIKSKNVDAIYFIANPGEVPLILKQIKELNINTTILANGVMETKGVVESSGEYGEGVYYAVAYREVSNEFKNRYKEVMGEEPDYLAALGYDVAILLAESIKECGGDDTDCIKNYLYNTKNYNGASGILSFDENGDVNVPFTIKKIESGERVLIKRI